MTTADLQKTVKQMADIEKHVKLVLTAIDVINNGIYGLNGSTLARHNNVSWFTGGELHKDTASLLTATNNYLASLKSAN